MKIKTHRHRLIRKVFLIAIGIGLIYGGTSGTTIGRSLWYWLDFRFWSWWLFLVVVVDGFLVVWWIGGKIEIGGILILGVMLLVRADFDLRTYTEGRTFAVRTGEKGEYDYQVYLPQKYYDWGAKRPLIVFLHGAGDVGKNIDKFCSWNLKEYLIEDGKELSGKAFPFIVVAPVTSEHEWKPERVVAFIDRLIKQDGGRLNIDPDRVYLTGYSMGGFGTFETACAYPDRFAAIAPLSGGGDPAKAATLQNVPTYAFHGDVDKVVDYSNTARMIEKMRELKHPNVKFKTYEGRGHEGICKSVYLRTSLYRWLLQQRKIHLNSNSSRTNH